MISNSWVKIQFKAFPPILPPTIAKFAQLHQNQYPNTIKLISIISFYDLLRKKNLIYCSIFNIDLLIDLTSANFILPTKTYSIAIWEENCLNTETQLNFMAWFTIFVEFFSSYWFLLAIRIAHLAQSQIKS